MLLGAFVTLLLHVSAALSVIIYAGVNESGGEQGVYSADAINGTGLPGEFGVNYAFINKTTVAIYVDQEHINFFRVCFLLERMCPTAYGLGAKFNETYFDEFQDAVNYITITKGVYAELDPHNYYRYNDPSQQPTTGSIIGNTADPAAATTAQWQEFWHELAGRFVDNPKVVFGIMNEPHDMPTSLVLLNDQAAIDGIRSAGANQLILAPGNGYTGGHSWNSSAGEQGDAASSLYMYKLIDPLHNTAIDIHEYLDVDFSGTHDYCYQAAPPNLWGLTQWLKQYNLKAFISEFGAGQNTRCYGFLHVMLQYLADNEEYIGWSAWAAGPIWGSFRSCCGDDSGNLEPGTISIQNDSLPGPGGFDTIWKIGIQPFVPPILKREGTSNLFL